MAFIYNNQLASPLLSIPQKQYLEAPVSGEIKNSIIDYWSQRVEDFSKQRLKEFTSEKHVLWMNELKKHIPMDKPLNILDLGTGTGFFSFLLSGAGHRTTGIDLTEKMIKKAREASAYLGLTANFHVMDAESPSFAPATFDVLVSRNLTWILPHLEDAYRAWHKLLKPGGILVNFDADYCRESKEAKLPENHAHKNIDPELNIKYEKLKKKLRPQQQPRPDWDKKLLLKAGFHNILLDTSVWKRIYKNVDEFYNPTPIFVVVANA